MADNVIRHDIIQLDFDIGSSLKEIEKLQNEIADLKKKLTGAIDNGAFDDLKDDANKSVKPLEKVRKQAEKIKQSITDIGKKAAGAAFNGLKKLASISFKALSVGLMAAAAGITAIVKNASSAYAEYEQLIGGVDTLFGEEAAKIVQENANKAFASAGLSANAYMNTVTSFSASLISSLSGDTVTAAKLSNTALIDMADNANKMGTPIENIQNAYQGFAKQNYTMLDNLKLGYGGTKTEMQRLVKEASQMEAGIAAGVKAGDMSFANIVKAIHAVQENMGIANATAEEAEGTITGSLSSVRAAWQNLMPAMINGGDEFDRCIDNFVKSAKTFGKNMLPTIEKALVGTGKLIEELAPIIEAELPELVDTLLPPLIKAATSLLTGLIKALPSIVKTIAKEIPNILKELGNGIEEAFGSQFPIIGKIGEFFTKNSSSIVSGIKKIIPVVIALAAAFKGFTIIKGITSFFGGLFGKGDKGGKGDGGGKGDKDGGFLGTLKKLANEKPTTILKGMGNLAIIIGGFTVLAAALMFVAPYIVKLGDMGSFFKLAVVLAAVGVVGGVLAKFGDIAGKIPVTTVLKGLANMAIMIAGVSVLLLVVSAVSMINFDYQRVLKLVGVIGVIGIVGTALALFGAVIGVIPVPLVALGLANMAIMLGGLTALLLVVGAVSLIPFDINRMMQIVGVIGVIGAIATALSLFAAVLGLIPIPVVLLGIANMALVLAGVAKLGTKLTDFANNTKGFFTTVATFPEEGFDKAGKLFNCLAGLKALPKDGGVIGWFAGNIDYSKISAGLAALSGEGVRNFFAMVGSLNPQAFTNTTALFKALGGIKALPKEGGLWDKITGEESSALSNIATELSNFGQKTQVFFAQVNGLNLEKLNGLWQSLKNAGKLTAENLSLAIDEGITSLVNKISTLPSKMGNALINNSKDLTNGFITMWRIAIEASIAPVNRLIARMNGIINQVGSSNRIVAKPYANGTRGHNGGNALVNDGRGAELVQMPNGNSFIPRGKNVFIPNAPVGMKVLSAENTARLFGRTSATFNYASYANGVGTIYTPESDSNVKSTSAVEYNTYSPHFEINISGTNDDRAMARKVKRWIAEAWDEMLDDLNSKHPQTIEA